MFSRLLQPVLIDRAKTIPVIAILGPRQSGKTTLARAVFNKHAYVSLENYAEREFATKDPQRFFDAYKNEHGIILDEIQNVPQLMSYLQTLVDAEPRPGYIVITGSHNILLNEAISQTLAGRITIVRLLPLSIAEMSHNNILPLSIEELAFKGCYPRIYAHHLASDTWYLDYIETYIERDARQLSQIHDLSMFRRFIGLCAGRTGQLLNVTSLANDCGIDQRTTKSWLSILEASYIIFLLQPYHGNFNKRFIKSPKLYFYDTGLACALLDIKEAQQLHTHYLRGGLIESLVVSNILKHYYNTGLRPHNVYFWRDQTGHEVDVIIQEGQALTPLEIKAGATIVSDFFDGLEYWNKSTQHTMPHGFVIYGGSERQTRSAGTALSWRNIEDIWK
jgi:predicted AAA+ superfamily ATPase